ncbi:MAG: general secretion pathway protein GspE [Myxococcales bacterium]
MASRIADILHRAKLIDDLQLRSATAHQAQWGGRIPTIVIEKKFVSEEKVVDAIANAMKLPKVDLGTVETDAAAIGKLDADFCKVNAVFPCALKDNGKSLWLAMVDPTNLPVVDEVALKAKVRVNLVVASERQVQAAIKRAYYGESPSTPQSFGNFTSIEVPVGEEEEGKIVDMSGHTLIKNIKDIVPQAAKKAPPVGDGADDVAFKDAKPGMVTGALQMLDEMFGPEDGVPSRPTWTDQDLERLRAIQDQQEKGARILRAVLDLCVAKGYFSPDEYRLKLKKLM